MSLRIQRAEEFHDIPLDSSHTTSADCWCKPSLDFEDPETGAKYYTHKELEAA